MDKPKVSEVWLMKEVFETPVLFEGQIIKNDATIQEDKTAKEFKQDFLHSLTDEVVNAFQLEKDPSKYDVALVFEKNKKKILEDDVLLKHYHDDLTEAVHTELIVR